MRTIEQTPIMSAWSGWYWDKTSPHNGEMPG